MSEVDWSQQSLQCLYCRLAYFQFYLLWLKSSSLLWLKLIWSNGFPPESIVAHYTDLLSSLVDELTQLFRSVHDVVLVCVLLLDLLSNLRVFPRGLHVKPSSPLKLLLGFETGVEDPLSLGKREPGSSCYCSLIKGLYLLIGESAVENFEVVAEY